MPTLSKATTGPNSTLSIISETTSVWADRTQHRDLSMPRSLAGQAAARSLSVLHTRSSAATR
jgi:hypothetical protein